MVLLTNGLGESRGAPAGIFSQPDRSRQVGFYLNDQAFVVRLVGEFLLGKVRP